MKGIIVPEKGDVWTYRKTGNRYWVNIAESSVMKIGASDWLPCVTYSSIDMSVDKKFTRDLNTFLEKFSLLHRPSNQVEGI